MAKAGGDEPFARAESYRDLLADSSNRLEGGEARWCQESRGNWWQTATLLTGLRGKRDAEEKKGCGRDAAIREGDRTLTHERLEAEGGFQRGGGPHQGRSATIIRPRRYPEKADLNYQKKERREGETLGDKGPSPMRIV